MRLLIAATLLALVTAGCGGDGGGDEPAPNVDPFGGGALAVAAGDVDTCLLVLLDGVRASELAGDDLAARLPNLARLRASCEDHGPAIATSTGGNAALASALTGLHARDHGVLSLRDLGRARLDARLPYAPERFQADGWRTIGAMSSPRHARGLGGFERGFDVFAAPRAGEPARSAEDVVRSVGTELEAAMGEPGRVLVTLVLDDAMQRGARIEHPRAAEIVRLSMAPFAEGNARVAAALERLDAEPEKGLGDFVTLFGRARGSREAIAWEAALVDIRLASIDSALGEVMELLERNGRGGRTLVLLGGLRGRARRGAEAGPALSPEAIEVPFWMRSFESARYPVLARRERSGVASVLDYAGIASAPWIQGAAAPTNYVAAGPAFEGPLTRALVASLDGTVHASRDRVLHVERYEDGQLVVFDGAMALTGGEGESTASDEVLEAFASSPALVVSEASDGVEVRWQVADGARARRPGERRAPPVRGGLAEMADGEEGEKVLPLSERGTAIRLGLRAPQGTTISPRELAMGGELAADLSVLYLPADGAPTVEPGGAPARLTLTRAAGLDWTLAVSGEGLEEGAKVDVLVSVWPPREPSDLLEVPASNVEVRHVAGRRDLVHLSGPAPLDVLVKRTGKERFAVSCAIDGVPLDPREMVTEGDRFAGPDRFDVLLPSWLGEVPGPDPIAALYDWQAKPPAATVAVHRRGFGPIPGPDAALEFDALEFVRTLPSYE